MKNFTHKLHIIFAIIIGIIITCPTAVDAKKRVEDATSHSIKKTHSIKPF